MTLQVIRPLQTDASMQAPAARAQTCRRAYARLMNQLALLLLTFMLTPAHAETFDDRVRMAKEAELADAYKAYQQVMLSAIAAHLASALKECFAKVDRAQTDSFILVSDVTREGTARSVEVSPATNIASCFGESFQSARFPLPPEFPGRDGFPIVIELRLKP